MWPRFNKYLQRNIYWFRGTPGVMQELRNLGFHDGEEAERLSDRLLPPLEGSAQDTDALLREWETCVRRTCRAMNPGYPTIWLPDGGGAAEDLLRKRFAGRLVEFDGSDLASTLHSFRMVPGIFGIIYHVACMGNWKAVVDEQFTLLADSGLNGINISLLGNDSERIWLEDLARAKGLEIEVRFQEEDLLMYEVPAIRMLADWAQHHDEGYVLYFHTKGVSAPDCHIRRNWRWIMGEHVIRLWRENCELLRAGYDAVGVNWKPMPPISHFAGNFFMARASFLRGLEEFSHYYRHPRHGRGWNFHRIGAEFWIGSGKSEPKVFSHVSTGEYIEGRDYWSRRRHLLESIELKPLDNGKPIRVVGVSCGHGTMGASGVMGFEDLRVTNSPGFQWTVSAHADSEVILHLLRPVRIRGFLNGSAGPCNGASFSIDGEKLGEVHAAHDVTLERLVDIGEHRLEITSLNGHAFCHTVWGINPEDSRDEEPSCEFAVVSCLPEIFETSQLLRWTAHHLAIGVGQILLTCPASTEGRVRAALRNRSLSDKVSIEVPGDGAAVGTDDLPTLFRSKARWLALVDFGEYLVPLADRRLPLILSAYAEYGGLEVGRRVPTEFASSGCCDGTSGHVGGFTVEGSRWIVQPRYVERMQDGQPVFMPGRPGTAEHFEPGTSTMHLFSTLSEILATRVLPVEGSERQRTTVAEWPREAVPAEESVPTGISGFMHVATVNHWRAVLRAQLRKMESSGLLEESNQVIVGVVGDPGGCAEEISLMHPKLTVAYSGRKLKAFEFPTLQLLQEHCRKTRENVWYIHTKGVANPWPAQHAWRNRMESFVLVYHQLARRKLHSGYRVAAGFSGPDDNCPVPGNFWWARADHIAALPEISRLDQRDRWEAERWIGKNGIADFYWHENGDTINDGFRIQRSRTAAGRLTTNGWHGWMRAAVQPRPEWPVSKSLSAHGPSCITLEATRPLTIFGFVSGTAEPKEWIALFMVNGKRLGSCSQPLARTQELILPVGTHLLEIQVDGGEIWGAHTAWAVCSQE